MNDDDNDDDNDNKNDFDDNDDDNDDDAIAFFLSFQLIHQLRKTSFDKDELGQIGSLCKRGTDNIQRVRKLSVAKQMLTGLF